MLGPKRMASAAPPGIQAQLHTVVSTDFAPATKWVLYGMAIALGLTFLAALRHPARHASRATVTDEQAVSEAAG